jgi:hypothetical protein
VVDSLIFEDHHSASTETLAFRKIYFERNCADVKEKILEHGCLLSVQIYLPTLVT